MEEEGVFWLLLLYFMTTSASSGLCYTLQSYIIQNKQWVARKYDMDEAGIQGWIFFLSVAWASLGWFSVSISFTLFNKYFFQIWEGGFDFPILLTTLHMGLKVVLTRWWIHYSGEEVPPLDIWTQLKIVIPIGVFTGADIVLSNMSILYIPLSLYTALKTIVPAMAFFFSVLIGLEQFRWQTFISIVFVALGLAIAVQFSADGSAFGIMLVLLASVSSGLRWALLQWLIQVDAASSNVIVAIYRFTPSSTLFLFPIAVFVELPRFLESRFVASPVLITEAAGIGCCGALLSIFLIGFEIFIVRITSSVTLGILGQAKEIAQIALAMVIYKEVLTVRTAIGLTISLVAANVYKAIKQDEFRDGEDEAAGERAVAAARNGIAVKGQQGSSATINSDLGGHGHSQHGLLHDQGEFGSVGDDDPVAL